MSCGAWGVPGGHPGLPSAASQQPLAGVMSCDAKGHPGPPSAASQQPLAAGCMWGVWDALQTALSLPMAWCGRKRAGCRRHARPCDHAPHPSPSRFNLGTTQVTGASAEPPRPTRVSAGSTAGCLRKRGRAKRPRAQRPALVSFGAPHPGAAASRARACWACQPRGHPRTGRAARGVGLALPCPAASREGPAPLHHVTPPPLSPARPCSRLSPLCPSLIPFEQTTRARARVRWCGVPRAPCSPRGVGPASFAQTIKPACVRDATQPLYGDALAG